MGQIIGVVASNFKYYPRVKALIEQKINYVYYQDQRRQQYEDRLLARVNMAIQELEEQNQPVTPTSVSEIIGISSASLLEYMQVKTLLDQKTNASQYLQMMMASHRFEDELLIKVEAALQQLTARGQKVTRRAIGEVVGVDAGNFVAWPRVKALLDQRLGVFRPSQLTQARQREDKLLIELGQAIQRLEQLGRPVTHEAVSEIMSISPSRFRQYPRVKTLLEQKVGEYHHHRLKQAQERETLLLEQVDSAIERLKQLGVPITQRTVSECVGRNPRDLTRYPRVKALLDKKMIRSRKKGMKPSLTEDELIAKVSSAIEELETSGLVVTQATVGRRLGVPLVVFRTYPSVMKLFSQAAEKRVQKKEEAFLVQVKGIVQELLRLDQPITRIAISERMHVTAAMLNYYQSVDSYVTEVIEEDRQKRLRSQFEAREKELERLVLEAMQQLQQVGQDVNVNAVTRIVHVSPNGLKRYPRVKAILGPIVSKLHRKRDA